MNERGIWTSVHGIALLAVLGGIAFASGFWGVLIALAPAVYLLVRFPHNSDNSPKTVLVSHLAALIVGWGTYTVLAQGIAPTSIEPLSKSGLRIVGSSLLAFVATTGVFYALHVEHPMAFVTTFTAAIGAFPAIQALVVVVVAILCVTGLQTLRRELGPEPDTESASPDSDPSGAANHR